MCIYQDQTIHDSVLMREKKRENFVCVAKPAEATTSIVAAYTVCTVYWDLGLQSRHVQMAIS